VTEQIVQVTGDPEALILGGHTGQFGLRLRQRAVVLQHPLEGEDAQPHDQDRDRGHVAEGRADAGVPSRDRGRDQQRGQGQHGHDREGPGAEAGHGADREEHGQDEPGGVRRRELQHHQRGQHPVEGPEPRRRREDRVHAEEPARGEGGQADIAQDRGRTVRVLPDRAGHVEQVEQGHRPGDHQPPARRPPALAVVPAQVVAAWRPGVGVHVHIRPA
jgi:hypothetical protein